ncbi:hypothetical protein P4B35_24230, partial [Pontiellaceae bacterium B12227]|nr:hypothetical protein [Pontiellaceae bacterium B12227]
MKSKWMEIKAFSAVVIMASLAANAALVAEYDMTDGDMLNDSTGNGNALTEYDATNTAGAGGVSLNAGGGYASFTGVGY